jgi:hypothetical protein
MSFYLYKKAKITFSSLIQRLIARLMSLHLHLISALHHAVVDVGRLDILDEVALINSYLFN